MAAPNTSEKTITASMPFPFELPSMAPTISCKRVLRQHVDDDLAQRLGLFGFATLASACDR